MVDLTTPNIPTAMVTQMTGGYANSVVLRNWTARGVFRTPSKLMPEPRAGKPRMFPLLAVYEAAMHAWGSRRGLPLSFVASAWSYRIARLMTMNGRSSGWVDDDFASAAAAGALTEFAERDLSKSWYWVVRILQDGDAVVMAGGLLICQGDGLAEAVATVSEQDGGALVINVTDIVADVHRRAE